MIAQTLNRLQLLFCTRIAVFAVLVTVCAAPVLSAAERSSEDQRLATALRTRRLFDLAESHCRDSLAREQLPPREQAMLTIELIRIHADRAYQATAENQAKHWQTAQQTAEDFLNANPDHPFSRVVKAQQVLVGLARGILLRQTLQSESSAYSRDEAMQQLRVSVQELESLEKQIDDDLLQKKSDAHYDQGLNEDEALSLRTNIRFHTAEAFMNRAMLHDEDDELNRIDALNRVREQLDQLQLSVSMEDPLWEKVLINRLECLRLQKDFSTLEGTLKQLSESGVELPATVEPLVEAELLRVAIDRSDAEMLKRTLTDKATLSDSAELSLARIEAILALAAVETDAATSTGYQQLAVSLTDQLEKRHGRYWSRRANNRLVASASLNPNAVDLSLLIRLADATYLKGDFDNAIRTYEAAAVQAEKGGDSTQQFDLLYKAALVQHQRREYPDAAARFTKLATDFPNHADAAKAHLLAIVDTAELAKRDPNLIGRYLDMLRSQLQNWPGDASTDQARVWYAAMLVRQQKSLESIEILLQIPESSEHFVDAIRTAGQRAEALIGSGLDSESRLDGDHAIEEQQQQLRERIGLLFAAVYRTAFADTQTPPTVSRWWARAVSAEIFGRLGFSVRPSDRQELLAGLQLDEPLPWELAVAIRSVLVFEFARETDEAEFAKVASQLVESDPQRAMLTVQQILDQKQLAPGIAARLPEVIRLLKANESELNDKSRSVLLTLDARTAAAAGDEKRAIKLFEELLNARPRDAAIRIEYATLLTRSTDAQTLAAGLVQWRTIARATKPRSREWFLAKYYVALTLTKVGQEQKAHEMLVYLNEIPPGWKESELKSEFDALLKSTE